MFSFQCCIFSALIYVCTYQQPNTNNFIVQQPLFYNNDIFQNMMLWFIYQVFYCQKMTANKYYSVFNTSTNSHILLKCSSVKEGVCQLP